MVLLMYLLLSSSLTNQCHPETVSFLSVSKWFFTCYFSWNQLLLDSFHRVEFGSRRRVLHHGPLYLCSCRSKDTTTSCPHCCAKSSKSWPTSPSTRSDSTSSKSPTCAPSTISGTWPRCNGKKRNVEKKKPVNSSEIHHTLSRVSRHLIGCCCAFEWFFNGSMRVFTTCLLCFAGVQGRAAVPARQLLHQRADGREGLDQGRPARRQRGLDLPVAAAVHSAPLFAAPSRIPCPRQRHSKGVGPDPPSFSSYFWFLPRLLVSLLFFW